jgi:hypothetical protein
VGLLLLAGLALGQEDQAKQKAVDQMRQVANAIKQCGEHKETYQDDCQLYYSYLGPPTNVEWDVLPSKTVRSPLQGFVEFELPSRSQEQDVDPANQSKKAHQECVNRKAVMAAMAAPALAELAKEGPAWREVHYRYEFDVGSDAPELVKMLRVARGRDNNVVTSAAESGKPHECWVAAAKSIGSARTENVSSPKP